MKLLILILLFHFSTCTKVEVSTKFGIVTGHTVSLSDGTLINSFLAIPFAKPPIGRLRFLVISHKFFFFSFFFSYF